MTKKTYDFEKYIAGYQVQYDITNGCVDITGITASPDKQILEALSEETLASLRAIISGDEQ